MPRVWRPVRTEGAFTTVQVDVSPGQVAEIPIRTELLGKPEADQAVELYLSGVELLRDALQDFT